MRLSWGDIRVINLVWWCKQVFRGVLWVSQCVCVCVCVCACVCVCVCVREADPIVNNISLFLNIFSQQSRSWLVNLIQMFSVSSESYYWFTIRICLCVPRCSCVHVIQEELLPVVIWIRSLLPICVVYFLGADPSVDRRILSSLDFRGFAELQHTMMFIHRGLVYACVPLSLLPFLSLCVSHFWQYEPTCYLIWSRLPPRAHSPPSAVSNQYDSVLGKPLKFCLHRDLA